MAGAAEVTIDHQKIREWVEARKGKPACVRSTKSDSREGCLLRIDFPGYGGEEELEPISWDEFFQVFDDNELAFLYQDRTQDGKESRFSKLVSRETAVEEANR